MTIFKLTLATLLSIASVAVAQNHGVCSIAQPCFDTIFSVNIIEPTVLSEKTTPLANC